MVLNLFLLISQYITSYSLSRIDFT